MRFAGAVAGAGEDGFFAEYILIVKVNILRVSQHDVGGSFCFPLH